MELLEYLGVRLIGVKGRKVPFGLYRCPICFNPFECSSYSIKSGNTTKCRRCSNIAINSARSKVAADTFISLSTSIHSNKYDYGLVNYTSNRTKVPIICPDHGVFMQTPHKHKEGKGCPSCAKTGFNPEVPAILYYLKISSEPTTYKIGISNRTVCARYPRVDLDKITTIKVWEYLIGAHAYTREQALIKEFASYRYKGVPILTSGNTELFIIDILGLDTLV